MAVVGSLSVELTAKIKRFMAGMKNAQQAAAQTSASLNSMAGSAARASLAMGVVGGVVAKMTADFEKSMTRAAAIAGKTEKGFSAAFTSMNKSALSLSASTEFTAKQVSEGMTFMAMAGNDAAKTIEAMPAVLQLASAAALDLGQSADIVTNVMAGFGLEGKDLKKTNNTLVGTFTNANVSLESLGKSFRKVGPTAKTLGVEFEDIAAVIGTLGNAGINSEEAGTGLRRALIGLVSATPKAKKAMEELGITTKTLGEKGLIGTLAQLEKMQMQFDATGDSAKFVDKLTAVFGQRAGPTLSAAVGQGTASIIKLRQAIDAANEGAGIAAFLEAKQLASFTGQMNILKSSLEATTLSFGQLLNDMILPGIKVLADFFRAVNNLSTGTKSLIVQAGLIIGVLTGVTAVLLTALAIIPSVVAGYGALAAALGGVGLSISGILIPAFAVLEVALVSFFTTLSLVEAVTGKNIDLFGVFADAMGTMAERADGVKIVFINMGAAVLQVFITLGETIITAFKHVANFVANVFKALVQTIAQLGVDAGVFFTRGLIGVIAAPLKKFQELIGVKNVDKSMASFIKAGRDITASGEKFKASIASGLDKLTPFANTTTDSATKALAEFVGAISDAGLEESNALGEADAKTAKEAADAAAKKAAAEKKAADAKRASALAAAKAAKSAKDETEAAKARAKALAQSRAALAKEIELSGAGGAEKEIFDLGELKAEFPEIGDLIGDRVRQILSDVDIEQLPMALERAVNIGAVSEEQAQSIADQMVAAAKNAEDIKNSLKPKPGLLDKIFSSVFKGIGVSGDKLGGLSKKAGGALQSVLGGQADLKGIGEVAGQAIASSPALSSGIGSALSSVFGAAGVSGAGALSGIGGAAGGAGAGAAVGSIAPGVGTAIGAGVGIAVSVVMPAIISMFKKVAGAIVGVFTSIKGVGDTINNAITSATGGSTKAIFGGLFNPLIAVVGLAVVAFSPLVAVVGALLVPMMLNLAVVFAIVGTVFVALLPLWIALGVMLVGLAAVVLVLVGALVTLVAMVVGLIAVSIMLVAAVLVVALLLSGLGPILLVVGAGVLAFGAAVFIATAAFTALAVAQGGLLVAFAGLVKQTESFADFKLGFEAVMDKLVDAVEPFFEGMVPLVGLFDKFTDVIAPMLSSMAEGGVVAKVLFNVFKVLAIVAGALFIALASVQVGFLAVIAGIADGTAFLIEGFISLAGWLKSGLPSLFVGAMNAAAAAVASSFGLRGTADEFREKASAAFQKSADALEDGANPLSDGLRGVADEAISLMPDLGAMADALVDVTNLSLEEANALGEELIARKKADEEFNSSLTNAPQGFKEALTRFRSIDPSSGAPSPGFAPDDAESTNSTQQFFIENLSVLSDSPMDLIGQLADAAERAAIRSTGSPLRSATQFNNGNQ